MHLVPAEVTLYLSYTSCWFHLVVRNLVLMHALFTQKNTKKKKKKKGSVEINMKEESNGIAGLLKYLINCVNDTRYIYIYIYDVG